MDIHLKRMDGVTATRLIKEQYPQIAVIGLSVEHKDYELHAMKKVGAIEVLRRRMPCLSSMRYSGQGIDRAECLQVRLTDLKQAHINRCAVLTLYPKKHRLSALP